jgi:hypothetical protein
MARKATEGDAIQRAVSAQERAYLQAMAADVAGDDKARKGAEIILAILDGDNRLSAATAALGVTRGTARRWAARFDRGGWKALITVLPPRGGDFLARYDQGYWAEQVVTACLDRSALYRAIPYGTSRSKPFTSMDVFREYMESEFLLQAWSASGRWKRPDLLTVSRELLRSEQGNDLWTPDLKHFDNAACAPYVARASAAIEVETSLWRVEKAIAAGVSLSFTVKQEDLEALRNWIKTNSIPLFIIQVFFDTAYVLPFVTLEEVIALPATDPRHAAPERDRYTKKDTYKIKLEEGVPIGRIQEPDVEGRVFTADNGKVTIYGRLKETTIEVADAAIVEGIAAGTLRKGP